MPGINDLLNNLPPMDFSITDAPTLILDPDPDLELPETQLLDEESPFPTPELSQHTDWTIAQPPKQIAPNR